MAFRTAFEFAGNINWFPGHQAKGLRVMQQQIRKIDVILEVRDARLPLTSINPHLERMARDKIRLVLYNKADLANSNMQLRITEGFKTHTALPAPLFTNAVDAKHVGHIMRLARDIGRDKAGPLTYKPEITMMVIGMPNVGKSSLINALRRLGTGRAKAAVVGSLPGVTRSVMGRIKVLESPATYLVDTPGVMLPHIANHDSGLKLGLIATIKDHLIGEMVLADYLLFTLNQLQSTTYVPLCGLTAPSDNIHFVLSSLAQRMGAIAKAGELDIDVAATRFLAMFRTGKLGRFTLDKLDDESIARAFRRTTADI